MAKKSELREVMLQILYFNVRIYCREHIEEILAVGR